MLDIADAASSRMNSVTFSPRPHPVVEEDVEIWRALGVVYDLATEGGLNYLLRGTPPDLLVVNGMERDLTEAMGAWDL